MPLHTTKISSSTLFAWLKQNACTLAPDVEHMFLQNTTKSTDAALFKELLAYFESAHLDAREYFHEILKIDLHPHANTPGSPIIHYPRSLPSKAIKGLFGEVLCGLVAEHFLKTKRGKWTVPVFLFRNHQAAEYYLTNLKHNPSPQASECFGRQGDDFLGVELDNTGSLIGVLVGEVKYRQTLRKTDCERLLEGKVVKKKQQSTQVEGVCAKLSRQSDIPQDLHRLLFILQDIGDIQYNNLINSMDSLLRAKNTTKTKVARSDIILIIYEKTDKKQAPPHIKAKPKTYTAARGMHAVEMHLDDAEELIIKAYSEIYK